MSRRMVDGFRGLHQRKAPPDSIKGSQSRLASDGEDYTMTETVMFVGDPGRQDVDDEEFVELLFRTEHPEGGISTATVLVPRSYSQESWAIERSRERACEACTNAGGGGATSVNVSLGW